MVTMRVDGSIGLVRLGYRWAAELRRGQPAVETRFLGRPAAVIGGPAGVRRFYDPRLRRQGAVPTPVSSVLFGRASIHGLDGDEHHHQKTMYIEALGPDSLGRLRDQARRQWAAAARAWEPGRPFVLFDQAVHVLSAVAIAWSGIPCGPGEVSRRAGQLVAVLDGFASPGPRYLRARLARRRLDRWATALIRAVRTHHIVPDPGTALETTAEARDVTGRLSADPAAAVALLNLVRPMVAVAWFVAFAGVALDHQPWWRARIADGDAAACTAFAHEVRRRYPFVPVLAARARTDQDVLGVPVPDGGYVILDVDGTDRDPRHWPDPDRFDPGRFLGPTIAPGTLVPQGGGDLRTGHRCPGEAATLVLLEEAVRRLALTRYDLPPQDLTVDLARIPARPLSGVVAVTRR
ncbi:cytochrome P450 [Jiangella asiatica]|uniref:Cytochrome P450 n=1 Tax=Jiangella asiatica TaxID=2530372 RepID=A0A4R5DL39_9ACTN|nr:cytochrome P450 [Jiangella asiatica]TDE14926.1 cytochrome P450 [Jiangella asiatica]